MKRNKPVVSGIIGVVLVLRALPFVGACATPAPAQTPPWKPPVLIKVGSTSTVSSGFVIGTAWLSGITERTGQKFRMTPGNATIDRAKLLQSGEVHFLYGTSGDLYNALRGRLDFKEAGWKPQAWRVVWIGHSSAIAYTTRGTSGIKTLYDIKRKRYPYLPSYPMINEYHSGGLAFANLTWDDVIKVNMGSSAEMQSAVLEGSCDVTTNAPHLQQAYDLVASIYGLHWLEMPFADKEAWARLSKAVPYFIPVRITQGAGVPKDRPLEMSGHCYQWACSADLDEQLVSWMTKQMHQCYDAYKGKHANLPEVTLDYTLDIANIVHPYHPGAIRYFKEIGRWTAALEARQQRLLAELKE